MEALKRNKNALERQGGFSLLELTIALTGVLVTIVPVGLALQSGFNASRDTRELEILHAASQAHMDTLLGQGFGSSGDPPPSPPQLTQLFGGNDDPGNITLSQLTHYPPEDDGWVFTQAGLGIPGAWRVKVSQDLDDDGAVAGQLETLGKLLNIRIFFDNRLILSTNIASEVKN